MNATTNDYRVIPRHIGKWEGTVTVLDANLQQTRSFKINQTFELVENKWVLSNTYTYNNGESETHVFDILPLDKGEAKIETESPIFQETTMQAIEQGDSTVNFNIFNSETGRLKGVETITLVSDDDRVRTTQMFDDLGLFKGLLVIVEHRSLS